MGQGPETRLTNRIREAITKRYPDSVFWKIHGSPVQESGIPDLVGCVEGLFIAIEVKAPQPGESDEHAQERATPGQRRQMGRIKAAGGATGVAITVEGALDIVESALEKRAERLAGAGDRDGPMDSGDSAGGGVDH